MDERRTYLGYDAEDRRGSPYARWYRPHIAPLAAPVRDALLIGARSPELFGRPEAAARLLDDGYQPVETGYTLTRDGGAAVFCLTPMPGVTPADWSWWFAWHGHESARYKLWHPQAHLSAVWADGGGFTGGYVGRTSRVVEYLGERKVALAIRFVPPAEFGLDETVLARRGEVAICARAGLDGAGLDTGAMIHHLRPTADGCEMRSRFWLAGDQVRPRGAASGNLLTRLAARFARPDARQASALLVHCAEEMGHLAGFLPDLRAAFDAQASGVVTGLEHAA